MADSSARPAPQRDSVDETSPLLPGDPQAQAGTALTRCPAEPSAPDLQNEPTPAHFGMQGAITASRVLLVASATSLLLGSVLFITYVAGNGDFELHWSMVDYSRLLGLLSFLCLFLSVVNLVLLTQARERNETSPPPLGILINVAALGFLCFCFVLATSYIMNEVSWSGRVRIDVFGVVLSLWLAVVVILGWLIIPGLVIFWLRGLIIWVRNTGSSVTWSLPGGQLTIEATIKFHRQEPLQEAQELA